MVSQLSINTSIYIFFLNRENYSTKSESNKSILFFPQRRPEFPPSPPPTQLIYIVNEEDVTTKGSIFHQPKGNGLQMGNFPHTKGSTKKNS